MRRRHSTFDSDLCGTELLHFYHEEPRRRFCFKTQFPLRLLRILGKIDCYEFEREWIRKLWIECSSFTKSLFEDRRQGRIDLLEFLNELPLSAHRAAGIASKLSSGRACAGRLEPLG
jgi:hypothetical protein